MIAGGEERAKVGQSSITPVESIRLYAVSPTGIGINPAIAAHRVTLAYLMHLILGVDCQAIQGMATRLMRPINTVLQQQ